MFIFDLVRSSTSLTPVWWYGGDAKGATKHLALAPPLTFLVRKSSVPGKFVIDYTDAGAHICKALIEGPLLLLSVLTSFPWLFVRRYGFEDSSVCL